MIGPAIVLAAVFAVIHVSIYVLIRGRTGARLPLLLVAAFFGAWAGDAVGTRLGIVEVALTVVAWLGIGAVALLAILGPDRRTTRTPEPGAPS